MSDVASAFTHLVLPLLAPVAAANAARWKSTLAKHLDAMSLRDLANHLPKESLTEQIRNRLDAPAGMECDLLGAKVWSPIDSFGVDTSKVHTFVESILSGRTLAGLESNASEFALSLRPHELSDEAIQLLNGRLGASGEGLSLVQLSQSARRRLGQAGADPNMLPRIRLTKLRFVVTGMGIGLLVAEFEHLTTDAQPLTLDTIAEVLPELARVRSVREAPALAWAPFPRAFPNRPLAAPAPEPLDGGLYTLLSSLLPGIGDQLTSPPRCMSTTHRVLLSSYWGRAFTYTTVLTKQRLPDAKAAQAAAFRLSRKATSDYQPETSFVQDSVMQPFSGITHAFSEEGGALIVESDKDDKDAQFRQDLHNGVSGQCYLPLAVWSFHEHVCLLTMSAEAAEVAPSRSGSSQYKRLVEHCDRVQDFRLHYRFAHASRISQHNIIYSAWRRSLSLDRLLDDLSSDIEAARDGVRNALDERRQHILAILAIGAGLFGLSEATGVTLTAAINKEASSPTMLAAYGLCCTAYIFLASPLLRGIQIRRRL